LKDMDLRDGLYKINIPVLIVHGKKDRICPVEAGRFLKDNIKNAFMHEIDEAGHAPFFTMPERFNSILEGFLSAAYSKKKS
ncbi:MAG: alpha/beta hydrolase, partial [Candidatus Omnitrophota bacterium]